MRARMRQPPARPTCLVTVTLTERLARAPVRRHPAPPCPPPPDPPEEGAGRWTSKTQLLEPSTDPAPCEAGRRACSSRSTPSSPVAGWTPSRLTFATRAGGPAPSRGAGLWWALLLPGGPTLLGFCTSSNRLAGASDHWRSAYYALRTRGPTDASPGVRRPVARTPRSAPHHSRLAP